MRTRWLQRVAWLLGRFLSRRGAPWIVLLIALALTAVGTMCVAAATRKNDELRFRRWVGDTRDSLDHEMDNYVALLNGVAGLWAGQKRTTGTQFRAYIDRLDLTSTYPGVQGVGFVKRIESNQAAKLEATRRRAGAASFHVWPAQESAGKYRGVVFYIEPDNRLNREALGYDMMTDPTRREAMAKARDMGKPIASARLKLVEHVADHERIGFVIYVPVYRGGGVPDTVAARRQQLLGFAFSLFRADTLINTIVSARVRTYVDISIYDGSPQTPDTLLYHSLSPREGAAVDFEPRFTSTKRFQAAGRPWTLRFASRPEFESLLFSWRVVSTALACGVLVSALLFLVTLSDARAHDKTERAAGRLQRSERALRGSENRLRMALAAAEMFAFTWDLGSGEVVRTRNAARVLGRDESDFDRFADLVDPRDWSAWQRSIDGALAGEHVHEMDFRIVAPDGQTRWMHEGAVVQRDQAGRASRMSGVCADVTRIKEAEEQLRELNQTLEQRVADRTREAEMRSAQLRALATEVTAAEQRERRRLANVLHDHLQQLLVAATMRLEGLYRQITDESFEKSLRQVADLIRESVTLSRTLTVELSPPVLYDAGFVKGLEWLARNMKEKHGLEVDVDAAADAEPTNDDLRAFLFQATRELLFNTVKHAGVDRASLTARRQRVDQGMQGFVPGSNGQARGGEALDGMSDQDRPRGRGGGNEIVVIISDNGPGFDKSVMAVKGAEAEHFGLFSIQQRLELLGGEMEVDSEPGEGSRITMRVPLTAAGGPSSQASDMIKDLPGAEEHESAERLRQNYMNESDKPMSDDL